MARQKLFSRRNQGPQARAQEDDLTRLRRGSFSALGSDTGDQPSYVLPFGRSMVDQNLSSAPQYQNRAFQVEDPMYEDPQPFTAPDPLGRSEGESLGINDFINYFNQSLQRAQPGMTQNQPGGLGVSRPVQQLPDGGVRFSDGRVMYPQSIDPGSMPNYQPNMSMAPASGIEGISRGLFGRDQFVTQAYGNYNPELEPGSGYNMGTDLRTRDLPNQPFAFPVGAEVVQILEDDGTRFGDQSGHMGYGNSVLLRLPTGEMFRLSHLDVINPQLQVGAFLDPGTLVGIPGATGNTTGEHLDVEYYNADGQISDPSTFQGFSNPTPYIGQEVAGLQEQFNQTLPRQLQPQAQQPQQQPQQDPGILPRPVVEGAARALDQAPAVARQAATSTAQTLARGITTPLAAPINAVTQGRTPELGITDGIITPEAAEARRQGAINPTEDSIFRTGAIGQARKAVGQGLENIGDRLGLKEGYFSEAVAGAPTKRSNVAFASDFQNAQDQKNSLNNSFNQAEEAKQGSSLYQNLKGAAGNALNAAGEGISSIQKLFGPSMPGMNARPNPSDIAGPRAVGNEGGNDLLANTSVSASAQLKNPDQAQAPNDIRDTFFKSGEAGKFTNFMKSGAGDRGALSLDIFKPEFFQDQGNINSVFSGTQFQPEAQEKYNAYVEEERRKAEEAERRRNVTLADYLAMGKTAMQWYAETGRQGELDALVRKGARIEGRDLKLPGGKSISDVATPSKSRPSIEAGINPYQTTYKAPTQTSFTPTTSQTSSLGTAAKKAGAKSLSDLQKSAAPKKKNENLFSRAYQGITSLFRR